MKKSPEYFRKYLSVLAATVSYVETSRVMGDDPSLIYRWINESKAAASRGDDPSIFYFDYDGETKWFDEHIVGAISRSISDIEANARSRALKGTYTPAKFQGKTVYQVDPDLEALGFEGPDAYKRDANGQPIPEMVWTPPSTDLVLAVLAAHSKKYRKQSSVDVNMNARISGGVMVVGNKPAAAQISAPPLPVLEIVNEATEPEPAITDEEAPADFSDDDDFDAEQTSAERPQPDEPVIRETPSPTYTPPAQTGPLAGRSGRPMSPLLRDLLSRASAPPEERSKPIGKTP